VLVGTNVTLIGGTFIRDRRTFARGCFKQQRLSIGGDISNISTSPTEITNMRLRCEFTGDHPVEVQLQGQVYSGAAGTWVRLAPLLFSPADQVSSVFISPNANQTGDGAIHTNQTVGMRLSTHQRTYFYPTLVTPNVGSYLVSAYSRPVENPAVGNSASVSVAAGRELILTVRELIHGPSFAWPTT
jgi:hypothetical protein